MLCGTVWFEGYERLLSSKYHLMGCCFYGNTGRTCLHSSMRKTIVAQGLLALLFSLSASLRQILVEIQAHSLESELKSEYITRRKEKRDDKKRLCYKHTMIILMINNK